MSHGNGIAIRRATRTDAGPVHRLLLELAAALGKSKDFRSTAADIEHFGFDQQPKVPRDPRLTLLEHFLQFTHGSLAPGEQGKQAQPRFIRDRLDRLQ